MRAASLRYRIFIFLLPRLLTYIHHRIFDWWNCFNINHSSIDQLINYYIIIFIIYVGYCTVFPIVCKKMLNNILLKTQLRLRKYNVLIYRFNTKIYNFSWTNADFLFSALQLLIGDTNCFAAQMQFEHCAHIERLFASKRLYFKIIPELVTPSKVSESKSGWRDSLYTRCTFIMKK